MKPHFELVRKSKNTGYAGDCFVCNKGTIREIRWYEPGVYYRTIEGFSQQYKTLRNAIIDFRSTIFDA